MNLIVEITQIYLKNILTGSLAINGFNIYGAMIAIGLVIGFIVLGKWGKELKKYVQLCILAAFIIVFNILGTQLNNKLNQMAITRTEEAAKQRAIQRSNNKKITQQTTPTPTKATKSLQEQAFIDKTLPECDLDKRDVGFNLFTNDPLNIGIKLPANMGGIIETNDEKDYGITIPIPNSSNASATFCVACNTTKIVDICGGTLEKCTQSKEIIQGIEFTKYETDKVQDSLFLTTYKGVTIQLVNQSDVPTFKSILSCTDFSRR